MRAVGWMSGLVVLGVIGSVGVALGGGGQRGGHGPQGGGHPGPDNHPGMGHNGHNHGGHGHGQGHGHNCPSGHAGAGGQGGQGGQAGTGGGAPPPSPCVGSPPASALITDFSDAVAGDPILFGTPPQIEGGTFSYAATGLTPPVLTLATGANGSPALAVASNPGQPNDPANGFFGFGLFFDSCVDASAYNAVKFTVNGTLGDCAIRFAVTSSENVSPADDPRGTCTETTGCFPPSTPITATGTVVVPFFGFTFPGSPNVVDPTSLVGIQWQMDAQGIACHASFTIDDISFIAAPPPPALNFTFDTDAQGWGLNTFVDTSSTNLAATPPPGVIPPRFGFTPSAGDPSPGSLALGVTYSDFNQYADVITNLFPPVNLSGLTVHARVRLVSGAFIKGGFQLHVSTGSTFVFAGSFLNAAALSSGAWVPIDLDLTTVTDPAFDASQVNQVGVQFFSGAPDGGPFPTGGGMITFEVDTVVTD